MLLPIGFEKLETLIAWCFWWPGSFKYFFHILTVFAFNVYRNMKEEDVLYYNIIGTNVLKIYFGEKHWILLSHLTIGFWYLSKFSSVCNFSTVLSEDLVFYIKIPKSLHLYPFFIVWFQSWIKMDAFFKNIKCLPFPYGWGMVLDCVGITFVSHVSYLP